LSNAEHRIAGGVVQGDRPRVAEEQDSGIGDAVAITENKASSRNVGNRDITKTKIANEIRGQIAAKNRSPTGVGVRPAESHRAGTRAAVDIDAYGVVDRNGEAVGVDGGIGGGGRDGRKRQLVGIFRRRIQPVGLVGQGLEGAASEVEVGGTGGIGGGATIAHKVTTCGEGASVQIDRARAGVTAQRNKGTDISGRRAAASDRRRAWVDVQRAVGWGVIIAQHESCFRPDRQRAAAAQVAGTDIESTGADVVADDGIGFGAGGRAIDGEWTAVG